MRQPATAILVIGAVLLCGCWNFYESLEMGAWHEAGSPQIPPPNLPGEADSELVITTLAPGSGQEVAPGDLVQVSITTTTDYYREVAVGDKNRYVPESPRIDTIGPLVIWLWTGREPPVGPRMQEAQKWGSLGSGVVRRALIGRQVGARFQVVMRRDSTISGGGSIPLYAFGLPDADTLSSDERLWPFLTTAASELHRSRVSEFEILKSCPGRLLRRTARVTQWGWSPRLWHGDGWRRTPTYRTDDLRWSALEGQCAPPDGKVRLEIGPIYWSGPIERDYDSLVRWTETYERARPREKLPHEYEIKRPEMTQGDLYSRLF
jgi:hypothetical protein